MVSPGRYVLLTGVATMLASVVPFVGGNLDAGFGMLLIAGPLMVALGWLLTRLDG